MKHRTWIAWCLGAALFSAQARIVEDPHTPVEYVYHCYHNGELYDVRTDAQCPNYHDLSLEEHDESDPDCVITIDISPVF